MGVDNDTALQRQVQNTKTARTMNHFYLKPQPATVSTPLERIARWAIKNYHDLDCPVCGGPATLHEKGSISFHPEHGAVDDREPWAECMMCDWSDGKPEQVVDPVGSFTPEEMPF